MSIHTVRLNDDAEKVLQSIQQETGMTITERRARQSRTYSDSSKRSLINFVRASIASASSLPLVTNSISDP